MITSFETGWIQTISGRAFYPLEPRIEDIAIEDIAWSLSMQCRYAGHVRRFYSVAEHCVIVSHAVPAADAFWGLMHDATEAYLMDLPRPIKACMPEYRAAEHNLMRAIALRFHLPSKMPRSVQEADICILFNERASLLGPIPQDWMLDGKPLPNVVINGWYPHEAYEMFMARFEELQQVQP